MVDSCVPTSTSHESQQTDKYPNASVQINHSKEAQNCTRHWPAMSINENTDTLACSSRTTENIASSNKAHEIMSEYSFSPNPSRSYGFSPLPNFPQNIDTPSLGGSLSIEPDENCSSSVIEFSSKSKKLMTVRPRRLIYDSTQEPLTYTGMCPFCSNNYPTSTQSHPAEQHFDTTALSDTCVFDAENSCLFQSSSSQTTLNSSGIITELPVFPGNRTSGFLLNMSDWQTDNTLFGTVFTGPNGETFLPPSSFARLDSFMNNLMWSKYYVFQASFLVECLTSLGPFISINFSPPFSRSQSLLKVIQ